MQKGVNSSNIVDIQADIQRRFASIKMQPYEMGTCKKVFRLSNSLGLAVTHGNSAMEKALIHDESIYLSYLYEHGYPVVKLHGTAFPVEGEGNKTRYGFLIDYIPNAVFIEVKSPALLRAQIFAALLGIPTQASEGWWVLNYQKVLQEISKKIGTAEEFSLLQASAAILLDNFKKLITKFETDNIAISDLQIMLSKDGSLTIIDPLDVVKLDHEKRTVVSIHHPEKTSSAGFIEFLMRTNQWLENAVAICHTITTHNPDFLKSYVTTLHETVLGYNKPLTFPKLNTAEQDEKMALQRSSSFKVPRSPTKN